MENLKKSILRTYQYNSESDFPILPFRISEEVTGVRLQPVFTEDDHVVVSVYDDAREYSAYAF